MVYKIFLSTISNLLVFVFVYVRVFVLVFLLSSSLCSKRSLVSWTSLKCTKDLKSKGYSIHKSLTEWQGHLSSHPWKFSKSPQSKQIWKWAIPMQVCFKMELQLSVSARRLSVNGLHWVWLMEIHEGACTLKQCGVWGNDSLLIPIPNFYDLS